MTINKDIFAEIGADIGERTKTLKLKKKDQRTRFEIWQRLRGDYRNFYWNEPARTTTNRKELSGTELVIIEQIKKILHKKNQAKDSSPVIAVDFGGMFSVSFLKIAGQMKKLIKQGKLVLAVTNRNFSSPKQGIKELEKKFKTGWWSGEKLYKQDIKLIKQNSNLVQYLNTDAAELRHQQVTLPNDKEYPLHRNIDLIHENQALEHDIKTDVDLPLIGMSLSEYGTFFLGSTHQYDKNYRDIHEMGKRNLIRAGAELYSPEKKSRYEIFLKPAAPRIN